MSKLSTQVQELEQKAEALDYQNKWLKIMLYRMITRDTGGKIESEEIEFSQFKPEYKPVSLDENNNMKYRMTAISFVKDLEVIATKPI